DDPTGVRPGPALLVVGFDARALASRCAADHRVPEAHEEDVLFHRIQVDFAAERDRDARPRVEAVELVDEPRLDARRLIRVAVVRHRQVHPLAGVLRLIGYGEAVRWK